MSKIQFWLSWNNNAERLRLPVNPEVVRIQTSREHTDVKVAQLGEYGIIGDMELREISFSSFFPRDYNPSYCEYADFPFPDTIIHMVNRWWESKKPVRLLVTNAGVNVPVTIRDFDYEPERAGSPGDVYYTLSLKEHRSIQFRKTEVKPEVVKVEKKERVNETSPPETYTVKSGDNLSQIALRQRTKGNDVTWQQIYEKNKDVIGKNPNLIFPGQKLVIPVD